MLISGATIIRNGVKFGYPFVESIKSILPICSEFIIAVGDSEDDTRKHIEEIKDPKIRIIDTYWDPNKRTGGEILSEQTNIALSFCRGDWIFYLQADEVVHEDDYDKILNSIKIAEKNKEIEGIVFNFLHFYGSYFMVQSARNWYKYEVRIIRNNLGIKSYGDAQGFRKNNKKIKAIDSGARIFHYGWVKSPKVMMEKVKSFQKLWRDDKWIEKYYGSSDIKDYFQDLANLKPFTGTHPKIMENKITHEYDEFIKGLKMEYLKKRSLREKICDYLRTIPIGEHKNFKLIKL